MRIRTANVGDGQRWNCGERAVSGSERCRLAYAFSDTLVDKTGLAHRGRVVAYDAESGKRLWETRTDAPVSAGPGVGDGLVLLCFFTVFLYYAFTTANGTQTITDQVPSTTYDLPAAVLRLVGGLVGLCLGGNWIVGGAVSIATHFGLSESVVGLSIVAVGTSLPELAASTMAAYKDKADIAVGNIVGSNIFNIFFVLGVTATFKPMPFNEDNNIDVLMTIFTGLLLFIFMFSGKKARVDRWEGALAVVFYSAYIGYRVGFP